MVSTRVESIEPLVASGTCASARAATRSVAHLLEHGIHQVGLERDGWLIGAALVHALDRAHDGVAGRLAIEIVQMEVVAVHVRDQAVEQIADPGVGVLSDREEEMGLNVRIIDAGGELPCEVPAPVGAVQVVQEELLELVEDHEHRGLGRLGGHVEGSRQVRRKGRHLAHVRRDRPGDRADDRRDGFLAPMC